MIIETDHEKEVRLVARIGTDDLDRRIATIWGVLKLNEKLKPSQRTPWINAVFAQFPLSRLGDTRTARGEWIWLVKKRLAVLAGKEAEPGNEKVPADTTAKQWRHPELDDDKLTDVFSNANVPTPTEKLLREALEHEKELVSNIPPDDL